MTQLDRSFWRTYLLPRLRGTFVLRVLAVVLGLVIHAVLTNLLGAEGYGLFAYAFSMIYLLSLLSGMGMQQLLTREVAQYQAAASWSLLKGILQWSSRIVFLVSLLLGALFFVITYALEWPADPVVRHGIWWALLSLPFLALVPHRQGALTGLHRIVWGQLPDQLVRPVVLLAFVGVWYWLYGQIGATDAILGNVLALFISFIVGSVFLLKALPKELRGLVAKADRKRWLQSGLAFLGLGGIQMVNNQADLIMLGSLADVADAGIYNIPARLVIFVYFFFSLSEQVLAPIAADRGIDTRQLQNLLRRVSRWVWGMSLLIVVVFILFRDPILSLFGTEFTAGDQTLIILCAGAVLHLGFGFSGYLLMMRGFERYTAKVFGLGALINIVLNAILIPRFGLEGAAIATVVGELIWRIGFWYGAKRKLSINTAIV